MIDEMQRCPNCLRDLELSDFYKNLKYRNQVGSWCKSCNRKASAQRRKDNPEKILEQRRQYRATHREHLREKSRRHYAANRERLRKRSRERIARIRAEKREST